MDDKNKKEPSATLASMRRPIPFHGGGAIIDGDFITLPECFWMQQARIYIFEPVDLYRFTFNLLIQKLPVSNISSMAFDMAAERAMERTTRKVVKSMHAMANTFFNHKKGKYTLFARWYEAYLSAFFLAMLEDLKIDVGQLSDPGWGDDLFFDDECNPLFPKKDIVLDRVKTICNDFKKSYSILEKTKDEDPMECKGKEVELDEDF